jgi:hypothetical protein
MHQVRPVMHAGVESVNSMQNMTRVYLYMHTYTQHAQVCSVSDLRLNYSLKAREALERLAYHHVNILRADLIEALCVELRSRAVQKEAANTLELRIAQALALGGKEQVPKQRAHVHTCLFPDNLCVIVIWTFPQAPSMIAKCQAYALHSELEVHSF